jgi:hypothetical protein
MEPTVTETQPAPAAAAAPQAPPNPAAILQLIGRARFRMRLQSSLEGATTATILAAATALFAIFAMRTELVSGTVGLYLLAAAGVIIVAGAVLGSLVRLDDETIARRIDRASNLSDRLSTAIAFRHTLATSGGPSAIDAETNDLMVAAIRDGVRAAPRANLIAATPFRLPKDLKAAFGFLAVSALAAGLAVPAVDRLPKLFAADPELGRPGVEVMLRGRNLMTGLVTPVAFNGTAAMVIGAPGAAVTKSDKQTGFVPQDASVYLGPANKGRPIVVLDWKHDSIKVRIPDDAQAGQTFLTVYLPDNLTLGPVAFEVLASDDIRNFKEDSVLLDADERAYVESILAQLKELAKREKIEDLDKFIAKIEQLLKDAEQGKISKEQLLSELAKAEDMLNAGQEPDQKEIAKKLGEMGKELQKNEVTKELGKALEKSDLEKAKQELEDLARKLEKSAMEKQKEELEKKLQDPKLSDKDKKELEKKLEQVKKDMNKDMEKLKEQLEDKDKKLTDQEKKELQKKLEAMKNEKPLTEKQKEDLQKQLENVSKQMQKENEKDKQKAEAQKQKLKEEVRRLEKQKQEAKTDQERLTAERELNKKKDELQKLDKDQEKKNQSAQREALKRLQRDMEKAAESLQKPNKNETQDEKDERERQASQKLKDAARETGRVDQDKRKQAQQKKMSSQMDDLREAMRRAKQKGNKGPNDPFGKQAKNKDFGNRARGQKGNGGAWRPGQGNQPGQGQGNQPGGQGNQPGGQKWGTGTDPNLEGDSTGKGGHTKDNDLVGKTGDKGGSRRETILAAAQKGFASKSYQKVYQDYSKIVEEVMRNEKLPASYRRYVKMYFSKIHPTGAPETVPTNTSTNPKP